MVKLYYYPILVFVVLFIQYFITFLLSKERNFTSFKENLISLPIASVILGVILYFFWKYLEVFNSIFLFSFLLSCSIYAYWFILDPLLYVFFSKKHLRDFKIESELKKENLNFKVYFTDNINSNAFASGIVPFYKIIIVANDLRSNLNKAELKAIIYHEIGHHKKRHILIMYILNVIVFTFYYLWNSLLVDYDFQNQFLKGLSIFLSGAMFGLVCYYIPNKILYFLEYQADSFSASENDRESMINALISLDKLTEEKLTQGNINHPNLEKRIANIQN